MPRFRVFCRAVALTAAVALMPGAASASVRTHTRLPRAWAVKHHLGIRSGARDPDRDGLSNWGEYRARTNPRRRDSDRDRIRDGLEDGDRDHLDNVDEITVATDPRRRDTDHDRISDGREDRDRDGLPNAAETPTGHLLLRPDTDGDGIRDGRENAGTITTVAGVTLTLRLAAGGSLTARLSGASWVECSSSVPASGSGGGSDASSGSVTQDPAAESGDGASTDPGSDPSDDLPDVEDDPAKLARVLAAADDDDGGDYDDETTDPFDDAPDLDSCASLVHVGAIVHEATIAAGEAGPVFSDFQLMPS